MKKIYSVLLLAISVIVLGTVSSCKDYDDDLYNNLHASQLSAQEKLQLQIDSLKSVVDTLNSCHCTPQTIAESIQNFFTTIIEDGGTSADALEALLGEKLSEIIKSDPTIIQTIIQEINPDDLANAIDAYIKEHPITGEQGPAGPQGPQGPEGPAGPSGGAGYTKEQIEGIISDYIKNNNIGAGTGLSEDDVDKLIAAYFSTYDFQKVVTNYITTEYILGQSKEEIQKLIDAAKDAAASDNAALRSEMLARIDSVATVLRSELAFASELSGKVEALENAVEILEGAQETINSKITDLQKDLIALETRVKANEEWIAIWSVIVADNQEKLKDVQSELATLRGDVTEQYTELTETIDAKYSELLSEIESKYGELESNTDAKFDELNEALNGAFAEMGPLFERINDAIVDLQERLDNAEQNIDALTDRIKGLEEYLLNKKITSIIVQGVATPLLFNATAALPVGLQSNVLCAYYGNFVNESFQGFPTTDVNDPTYIGDKSTILTVAELGNDVELEDVYQKQVASTAGKLYVTINPSTVNFTGKELKLVDSQNNEAGITLGKAIKSNHLLTFGVGTRAEENNGFYEVDASLDMNKIENIKINTEGLKAAAKEVRNVIKNRQGVKDMVTTALKSVSETITMPAYAIQASYKAPDANGDSVLAYVHSNYNIAATAIKPLSYNLDLESVTKKIPHKYFSQISYLNDVFNTLGGLNETLKFEFTAPDFSIAWDAKLKIVIDNIKLGTQHVEGTANTDPTVVYVNYTYEKPIFDAAGSPVMVDGKVQFEEVTLSIPVTVPSTPAKFETDVDLDDIAKAINEKVVAQVQAELTDLNVRINNSIEDLEAQINSEIEKVLDNLAADINGELSRITKKLNNISGAANSIISRVDRILAKVYGVIDNANFYMQPLMMVDTETGYARVSPMSSAATRLKATSAGDNYAALYPSSYTAEILNPAYKKFVKVVNVTGADEATCAAAKELANSAENMNKVIDGTVRAIQFNTNSNFAGCTYEIVYAALDYSGYQTAQRYYIKVVK